MRLDRFSGMTVRDRDHAMSIIMTRHRNAPLVGETVPDSMLIEAATGNATSLHCVLQGKPLVLIFGSYSCNNFDMYFPDLTRFQEKYDGEFDFAVVYIREAHPEGGFMPMVLEEGAEVDSAAIKDAATVEERRAQARALQQAISPEISVYVDKLDDEMAVRWGAWPQRIFVIDPDQTVLYSGGPGPWYFNLAEDGWHSEAPDIMRNEFFRVPFSRESLERFLESYANPGQ